MSAYSFDAVEFRALFPAFSNATTFPDSMLNMYWDIATNYIANDDYGALSGTSRGYAINLMGAHLTALSVVVAGGQVPGMMTGAKIDKINVTLTPPPIKSQYHWWLGLTPYGQQLLALLSVSVAPGFFIGGLPERSAFRKVGGVF